VVVCGVILLPLPGPGWVVIFAGIAVLATEFVWAQLVLHWAKRRVTDAAHRALDPRARRRTVALSVTGAVLAAAAAAYLWRFGPVPPWGLRGR
jgi:uncharacterized protein (TIGR02611 family)